MWERDYQVCYYIVLQELPSTKNGTNCTKKSATDIRYVIAFEAKTNNNNMSLEEEMCWLDKIGSFFMKHYQSVWNI